MKKNMLQRSSISVLFIFMVAFLFPEESSLLKRANDAFLANQTDEAKALYLNALEAEPSNPMIYLNLGLIYEQIGDHQMAISYYQKGLPYAGTYQGKFYNNLGNAYYMLGDYANAEKMYSSAIVSVPTPYSGYLSRANTRVKLENYDTALRDYQTFLQFVPDTSQREQIEKMIGILQKGISDAEAARLAAEAKRLEEEEKQRNLLESVLNSLNTVSTETKNLSAGSENVETPDIEMDIVD